MRLLGVELTRLRSRRAVVVILLAAAALAALMVVSAGYDTRPPDATERAAAEQAMAQEAGMYARDYQDCLRDPAAALGPSATAADCEANRPRLDWYLARGELDLAAEVDGRGTAVLVMLAGLAVVIGTTFSGADWASGSMSNQLLFEPRRVRVWLAKAAAVSVGTTVAAAVVVAGFWGALAGVAASRDIGIDSATWTDVLQTSGRGLVLVAAAALGAYALTMLLRSTVGTLGLLFAYVVAGEGLAAALPFERMSEWSMAYNVLAWVGDGVRVYDPSICDGAREVCNPFYTLSLGHGAAYLGALLVVAVVASVASFRSRDVP